MSDWEILVKYLGQTELEELLTEWESVNPDSNEVVQIRIALENV